MKTDNQAHLLVIAMMAILLGSGIVFSGYVEERDILVIDAKTRAVEGASVIVEHQLNHIDGIVNTTPFFTNNKGLVHIKYVNTEYQAALTNYNYKVYVEYKGYTQAVDVVALQGGKQVMAQLPLYGVIVFVHDQSNKPLKANVTLFNMTRETDAGGIATYAAPAGTHEVILEYLGVLKAYTVTVSGDDAFLEAPLAVYHPQVAVSDDSGNPIPGTLKYGSQECDLSGGLACNLTVIGEDQFNVTIQTADKTYNKTLLNSNYIEITIDLSPPSISDVDILTRADRVTVTATITDPGPKASGVDTNDLPYISYTAVYPSGVSEEGRVSMLPQGGIYAADLSITSNCEFNYVIYAKDRQGNINSVSGTETIIFGAEPDNQSNGTIPCTGSGCNPTPPSGPSIWDWFTLRNIVSVIILMVLVATVWTFIKKYRENI